MIDWIYSLDFSILNWIQENLRCDFLDAVLVFITKLGNGGIVWIALSVVLLCFKKYRKTGVLMLASLAFGLLLGEVFLKHLVARMRPFTHVTGMELLITAPGSYSFPSGHSWSSFTSATILLFTDKRIGIPAIILAALIAFSRMYLYVHFPSDVLVGSLCGVLTGLLAVWVMKQIQKRQKHSLS